MSFIKSDSLLSNIKNISIRIDMRPNDGSNIFKSIFENIQERQKSIKFESLFDIDCEIKQGNSLIDKLTGVSQQPTNESKDKEKLHYNWIVCKNAGMSENQGSQSDDNNADSNQQKNDASHLQHLQKEQRQNPLLISNHNGFIFPSLENPQNYPNNNNSHPYHPITNNNQSYFPDQNSHFQSNNNSLSQFSFLQSHIHNNNPEHNHVNTPQNRYLQNSLSLSSLNYLQQTSSTPQIAEKKVKNQTKNIPKNYGKAIICYIQKYKHKVELITEHFQIDYFTLLQDLKKKKKSINTIADLRNLWSKYKYAKCMRVITYEFLRKHALSYIFDSRICTYGSHIKYRQRLCEAVASPEQFKHIKDY